MYERWGKRALDRAGAAALLAVLTPLMALVALSALLALGRPVLFRQARAGRGTGRHRSATVCAGSPGWLAPPSVVGSAQAQGCQSKSLRLVTSAPEGASGPALPGWRAGDVVQTDSSGRGPVTGAPSRARSRRTLSRR